MSRRSCRALLVALVVAAAVPSTAAAATSSTVLAPVDGTKLSYDDAAPEPDVTVSGTSSGLTSTNLRLMCDDGRTKRQFGPPIPVQFNDKFSVTLPLSTFADLPGPCLLRAPPAAFNPSTDDVTDYHGRKVLIERVRQRFNFGPGPGAGKPADYGVFQEGTAAGSFYNSIADCGLCDSKLFDPASFTVSAGLWSGNGEVFPIDSGAHRSYLQVDGRNSVTPGYDGLQWGDGTLAQSLPGLDPIEYSVTGAPAPTGLTINETDHFDRCDTPTDPAWLPPTKSSCPSFVRTGIRVDRTITQTSEGTEITIVDNWTSEDGQPHDLDLYYDELEQQSPHKPSYAFPWVSPDYATHAPGDAVPAPPSAPATWFVSADSTAPDGSTVYPQGALTVDPVPDATTFRNLQDPPLRYHRTVAAGATLTITQVFDMATTRAQVSTAASAARDRLTPPPPGTGPPSGPAGSPPAGSPPAAFGARPLVKLSLATTRIAAAGPLKVRVANGNAFPVAGSLSGQTVKPVSVAGKHRVKLKAKAFTVTGNGRKTISVSLPRSLRRLLKRNGKLSLALTAKVTDPAGNARTVRGRVAPKLQKKKRRSKR